MVDADCNLRLTGHGLARVLIGVSLVDAAHGASLVGLLRGLDEVPQHLAPVNLALQLGHDVPAALAGHRAPRIRLARFLGGFANVLLDAFLRHFLDVVGDVIPALVVVKDAIWEPGAVALRRVALALAALTFATLALAFRPLGLVIGREVLKVPLGALTGREVSEGAFARHAAALRQFAAKVRVDGEVCGDVPLAGVNAFRLAVRDVGKDKVVKLVLQHAGALLVRKSLKKLGIVDHLKLSGRRVDANARGRDARHGALVHPPRDSSEERLAHKQSGDVLVEVKGFGGVLGRHRFPHFLQLL